MSNVKKLVATVFGTALIATLIFTSYDNKVMAMDSSSTNIVVSKSGEVSPMWWTDAAASAAGGAVGGAVAGAGGLSWSVPGTLAGAGAGAVTGAVAGAASYAVATGVTWLLGGSTVIEAQNQSISDIVFDH